MSGVVKRPLLTEKNNVLAEKNIYVFQVDPQANKVQIREHIEKYFDVKVKSVKTAIYRSKARRTRVGTGHIKYNKKAIIRLREGQRISLFEGA